MKPSFSIGDALSSPFRIARRKTLSMLVWGLLMVLTAGCIYALMIPLFAAMPVGSGQGEEAMTAYMEATRRLSPLINLFNVLVYLIMLLVWTAAGRAALNAGRGDRFAFIRIGMDEVRVAVVTVAWFLGWYLSVLIVGMIGAAVVFALWFASHTAAVVVGCVLGLILIVAAAWLWLRLSLIGATSLILKDFAFAQGWALTKGQALNLLGLQLLKWLIGLGVGLALYLVVGAILAAGFFAQGLSWPQHMQTLRDLEPVARAMAVPGAIALIPAVIFYGFYIALSAAPNVVAARHLLDGAPIRVSPVMADAPPSDAVEPTPSDEEEIR